MLSFYLSTIETAEEKVKFEDIYYEYRADMKLVAHAILHNQHDEEDAVHNAFLKIILNLHKINEISCHKTYTYIVTIVRSVAIDIYRDKQRRRSVSFENVPEAESGCVSLSDFSKIEIKEIIGQLNQEDRDILLQRYVCECDYKQLAKSLCVTETTARKRVERAKKNLAALLAQSEM